MSAVAVLPAPRQSIKRYFDGRVGRPVIKVLPGELYISDDPEEMLVTVLGSCVAVCLRDPVARVGGINHFMLPEGRYETWKVSNAALRYGNGAIPALIDAICVRGGLVNRLEVKLFGGSNMGRENVKVGMANADYARTYFKKRQMSVLADDMGGPVGRRIEFCPATGRVRVHYLNRAKGIGVPPSPGFEKLPRTEKEHVG